MGTGGAGALAIARRSVDASTAIRLGWITTTRKVRVMKRAQTIWMTTAALAALSCLAGCGTASPPPAAQSAPQNAPQGGALPLNAAPSGATQDGKSSGGHTTNVNQGQ